MNNFIFKSPRRLVKNSSISLGILDRRLELIQTEMRHQRSDLHDITGMLNRLLIDKHLQMQVDNYFDRDFETDVTHDETKRDLD